MFRERLVLRCLRPNSWMTWSGHCSETKTTSYQRSLLIIRVIRTLLLSTSRKLMDVQQLVLFMRTDKYEVGSYLSKCRAKLERKITQCDEMFTHHHTHCVRSYTKKSAGSSIMADGSHLPEVLTNWANHVSTLRPLIIHFCRMQRAISSWTLL